MKARLILFSGLLAGSVLVAASADEVVLYDAATPTASVVTTGGVVSVTGSWDLSRCGSFAVEIDGVDGWKDGAFFYLLMENENALAPDSRGTRSRGAFRTDIYLEKDVSEIVRPIPPAVPMFQACVAELDAVDVSGLFDLLWPNDCWGGKGEWGNEVKAWTLDPSRVVRVSFVQTGVDRPPRVRRIVARGSANRPVEPLPLFATVSPDRFFPFIDKYGQFKWRDWPGKVKEDADFARAIAAEDADLAAHPGPGDRNKWGGWLGGPRLKATGSFRVEKVNGKWWFVDPDGCLWWSHGPVRVSPSCGMTSWKGREKCFEFLPAQGSPFAAFYKTRDELLWPYYVKWGNKTNTYDFTASNLYRKYGPDWVAKWAERTHRRLRSWGANTIANSSDVRVMRLSKTPYCDRFEIKSRPIAGTENLGGWWPFRDPFDPSFRADVRLQMCEHKAEMDDPWCFGFFVDNELQWGAPGDLGRWTWASPDDQPAKVEFRRWMRERHGGVTAAPSSEDFEAFSRVIVNAYFSGVRDEFKRFAPQKLYMGCRFSGAHDYVVREAAKYVDVMSFNYYKRDVIGFNRLPSDIDLPVIIGEFHFGALDRAPFRAGIIQLKDQVERGETYRRYLTSALRDPRFVGAHWHQYCDDVATGRFDGENFQIGWVDICDNPYPETIAAVRWVGENMYRIRAEVSRPEVPLLSERQKALLDAVPENLSGSPALFDEASSRAAVAAVGWHPQPVRLSYGGLRCSGDRVTVREAATGAVAWEGAGEGWFADAWNLKVGTSYDWTVTDVSGCVQARGSFVTEDRAPRLMKVDGVPNVRDLGGWRGLDGRRIRQGLVYRTAGFNDNATAVCYDYEEVRRLYAEGRLLPLFEKGPESNDVRRLIAHLERGDVDVKRDVKDLFPKPNGRQTGKTRLNEATRRYLVETLGVRSDIDLRGKDETWGMTESPLGSSVRWFPCPGLAYGDLGTADGKRRFAKAFRIFLDPANYPIAFHCIGGQDRTGAVACILEAMLGVEENDLWRDWQLSALYNDLSRFGGPSGTRRFGALLDVLKACSGETLAEKAAAYVKSCGFQDADIAAVREFLLEPVAEEKSDGVKWIDGARLPMEGNGFGVTTRRYSRLPADAWARMSPEIRALADHASGLRFRFRTDSKRLRFRWSVTDGKLAGWNMAPQGKSGLDVYEEETGRHICVGIPERRRENVVSCRWDPLKTCLVYLPLFNGVEKVEVGVDAGCTVTPVSHPADEKPVVFYGGSIVQGACATRPGLAWVNIAGRLLGRETVNLGFSGQGCMEPELVDALARIDAAAYVISPFGNMTREQADARYESGIRRLRTLRPKTPIVLGEHCYYRAPHDWKHEAVGKLYEKLKAEGWQKLAIVRRDDMWPKGDVDGTADGGHPNDRGEWTMAEAFAAGVKGILQMKGDK